MQLVVSAPFEARIGGTSRFALDELPPFQAALGLDAIIAVIAEEARSRRIDAAFTSVPEIDHLNRNLDDQDRPLHLRLGPLREPKLLRGAMNAVLVTETLQAPAEFGRHPFAGGFVVPARTDVAVTFRQQKAAIRSVTGRQVPVVTLGENAALPFLQLVLPDAAETESAPALLQSYAEFRFPEWQRRHALKPQPPLEIPEPAVLVPWNLAHPGSLIPDFLQKLHWLEGQGRCPVTAILMPYNDCATGLAAMRDRVKPWQSLAEPIGSVRLLRAVTLGAAAAALRACRCALIDSTDPEWAWTADRLQSLGLPVTALGAPLGSQPIQTALPPEEEVTVTNADYGRTLWRGLALSFRQLASLAGAIARAEHVCLPLLPARPAWHPGILDTIRRAAEAHHGN